LRSILEINFRDQFFGNLKTSFELGTETFGVRALNLSIMSTRFHFLYRIDMWSIDGAKVIEHLAGAEDFQVAMATYRAACERWPGMPITLSQSERRRILTKKSSCSPPGADCSPLRLVSSPNGELEQRANPACFTAAGLIT
jgi:hypothetical protein